MELSETIRKLSSRTLVGKTDRLTDMLQNAKSCAKENLIAMVERMEKNRLWHCRDKCVYVFASFRKIVYNNPIHDLMYVTPF